MSSRVGLKIQAKERMARERVLRPFHCLHCLCNLCVHENKRRKRKKRQQRRRPFWDWRSRVLLLLVSINKKFCGWISKFTSVFHFIVELNTSSIVAEESQVCSVNRIKHGYGLKWLNSDKIQSSFPRTFFMLFKLDRNKTFLFFSFRKSTAAQFLIKMNSFTGCMANINKSLVVVAFFSDFREEKPRNWGKIVFWDRFDDDFSLFFCGFLSFFVVVRCVISCHF